MKNRSILLMVVGILLLSCQKEADLISPAYSEMSGSFYSESDSTGTKPDCKGPHGKPPKPEEVMAHLDTDQDHQLSRSEVRGPLEKDFDKVDTNHDNFISIEELKAGCPPPPPASGNN